MATFTAANTSFNIPGAEIFKTAADDSKVWIRTGDQVYTLDLNLPVGGNSNIRASSDGKDYFVDTGQEANNQNRQARWMSELQNLGINFDSLPIYNPADVYTFIQQGLGKQDPQSLDYNSFKQIATTQLQPAGNIDISQGQTVNAQGQLVDAQGNILGSAMSGGGYQQAPEGNYASAQGQAIQPPTVNLQPGQSGAEVTQLQNWLISQGYQIPAGATGYYGDQTKNALAQWQADNGVDNSTGVGYYGPRTIAAVNSANTSLGGTQTGSTQTGGATPQVGSSGPEGTPDLSGYPPEFQQLYTQLDTYLKKLQANGQAINPNITIDDSKLQEFAAQAAREIDPYYSNLLKTNVSDFLYSLGYSSAQLQEKEKQLEQKLGTDYRTLSSGLADQGFAQSGARNMAERELANSYNQEITSGRQDLAYKAGSAARSLAGAFGASNVPSFSLNGAPNVGAGETTFGRSLDTSPLYNLSDTVYQGLTGTKQFEQEAAKRDRASQLEEAFRSNLALNQQRSLTL